MAKLIILVVEGALTDDAFLIDQARGMNYGELEAERRPVPRELLTDGTAVRTTLEEVFGEEDVRAAALIFPEIPDCDISVCLNALCTAMRTWDIAGVQQHLSSMRNLQAGFSLWGFSEARKPTAATETVQ